MFFFRALLIYFTLNQKVTEDSDNNLTSNILELLPDIIIQDNRKAPHILFINVNL